MQFAYSEARYCIRSECWNNDLIFEFANCVIFRWNGLVGVFFFTKFRVGRWLRKCSSERVHDSGLYGRLIDFEKFHQLVWKVGMCWLVEFLFDRLIQATSFDLYVLWWSKKVLNLKALLVVVFYHENDYLEKNCPCCLKLPWLLLKPWNLPKIKIFMTFNMEASCNLAVMQFEKDEVIYR